MTLDLGAAFSWAQLSPPQPGLGRVGFCFHTAASLGAPGEHFWAQVWGASQG